MLVQVIFTYDEESRLWEPVVKGCTETLEAKQAFNAVVLTCQQLDMRLCQHNKTEILEDGIKIIPAV